MQGACSPAFSVFILLRRSECAGLTTLRCPRLSYRPGSGASSLSFLCGFECSLLRFFFYAVLSFRKSTYWKVGTHSTCADPRRNRRNQSLYFDIRQELVSGATLLRCDESALLHARCRRLRNSVAPSCQCGGQVNHIATMSAYLFCRSNPLNPGCDDRGVSFLQSR